ncbi:MAG: hypothetical protein A2V83_06990 [Nitrospirae bacterium RBG_16_64_22]|nr:MAG: hypothetical protein A2V83_06990 [Nitrospirae bacterium RBG_16_64_22]
MPRPRLSGKQRALLLEIVSQPTAPFREHRVAAVATRTLEEARVPFFEDPAGNIVVGVPSRPAYARLVREKSREPVRFFMAHMDHPGFHGLSWIAADRLKVKWHGASPVARLIGAPVWIAAVDGNEVGGRIAAVKPARSGRGIDTAEISVDSEPFPRRDAKTAFGGFRFKSPVWTIGNRVYARAADDLIGVFTLVWTAIDVFSPRKRSSPPFVGLLTRAEEVGFIGAIAHFERGWLARAGRPIVCVSLETSRALPGAEIGRGPVVRLGDRQTVFNPGETAVLSTVAEKTLGKNHQRRIMDAGTCEAAAALAFGFSAVGISVPLGNYHNQSIEGGPDSRGPGGPAPEFVDLRDVAGELALCAALLKPGLPWADPWRALRNRLRKRFAACRPLLDG